VGGNPGIPYSAENGCLTASIIAEEKVNPRRHYFAFRAVYECGIAYNDFLNTLFIARVSADLIFTHRLYPPNPKV
jgi:hypothetical protein